MQSVAFCCECVMALVRSAALPPLELLSETLLFFLLFFRFYLVLIRSLIMASVMIVVFCSALTHNAVSQWELMCAEL